MAYLFTDCTRKEFIGYRRESKVKQNVLDHAPNKIPLRHRIDQLVRLFGIDEIR